MDEFSKSPKTSQIKNVFIKINQINKSLHLQLKKLNGTKMSKPTYTFKKVKIKYI